MLRCVIEEKNPLKTILIAHGDSCSVMGKKLGSWTVVSEYDSH